MGRSVGRLKRRRGIGSWMRPGSTKDGERDFFEIDRNILIGQVNALVLIIENVMTELAMVAAENVFDKPLSAKLKVKARAMARMAQRLNDLSKVLARAKSPRTRR
jgi:hypothetical protein